MLVTSISISHTRPAKSHFALSGLQNRPAQDAAGAGGDERPHPDLLELGADAHEHTKKNDANDELDDLTGTHM